MIRTTTEALVLRRAEYGDFDRMLTLLTPERGVISAVARGVRRTRSPLSAACEPFCMGEFSLCETGDRVRVESCAIGDCFLPLRADYDRLVAGAYFLRLLETAAEPETPARELYALGVRSLLELCEPEIQISLVVFAFESHYLRILGMSPILTRCAVCGQPFDAPPLFSSALGGAVCSFCADDAVPMSEGARRILHKLPKTAFSSYTLLSDRPEWSEAARLLRRFLQAQLDRDAENCPPLP